jgi:HAMP domain-containing protein
MTFRTRLLLVFTLTVVASVGMVEWLVTRATRDAFERMERQRADALVAQFQREFDARGQEIVRAIRNIAQSDAAVNVAISADDSAFYNEASAMARAHGLGLLELVAAMAPSSHPRNGRFVSGMSRSGWRRQPDGSRAPRSCGAKSCRTASLWRWWRWKRWMRATGNCSSRAASSSTRISWPRWCCRPECACCCTATWNPSLRRSCWLAQRRVRRNFSRSSSELSRDRRPQVATLGSGSAAETIHALPLAGVENNLLAVLRDCQFAPRAGGVGEFARRTGAWVAAGGILTGMLLAVWATARVTRPVRRLAASAGQVAAGNWNTTVEVTSRDEIGQLAQAFNRHDA